MSLYINITWLAVFCLFCDQGEIEHVPIHSFGNDRDALKYDCSVFNNKRFIPVKNSRKVIQVWIVIHLSLWNHQRITRHTVLYCIFNALYARVVWYCRCRAITFFLPLLSWQLTRGHSPCTYIYKTRRSTAVPVLRAPVDSNARNLIIVVVILSFREKLHGTWESRTSKLSLSTAPNSPMTKGLICERNRKHSPLIAAAGG